MRDAFYGVVRRQFSFESRPAGIKAVDLPHTSSLYCRADCRPLEYGRPAYEIFLQRLLDS